MINRLYVQLTVIRFKFLKKNVVVVVILNLVITNNDKS